MANTKKSLKQPKKQLKLITILSGVLLTLGWTLLLATTTWLVDLPCIISPMSCSQGVPLANLILFSPAIIGAIALPTGILYDFKSRREVKVALVIAIAGALLFVCFWLLVYVGIAIHGLQG